MIEDLVPIYYTQKENGLWLSWPKELKITREELKRFKTYCNDMDFEAFSFSNIRVHSILFKPTAKNSTPIWDTFNGFRR